MGALFYRGNKQVSSVLCLHGNGLAKAFEDFLAHVTFMVMVVGWFGNQQNVEAVPVSYRHDRNKAILTLSFLPSERR